MKTFGSGSYRFDLCYTSPDGKEKKRIRQAFETIIDMRYPPRVALGDWIDDPRNKQWEWAKPQLVAESADRSRIAAEQVTGAKPTNHLDEISQLADVLDKVRGPKEENASVAIQLLKMFQDSQEKMLASHDPKQQLELAAQLSALANPGKKDDSAMSLLITMLMEDRKAAREEMRELRNTPQQNPLESTMGIIKQVTELIGGFGVNIGGGGGKQDTGAVIASTIGDITGKVIDGLSTHLPSVLQTINYAKQVDLQKTQLAQQTGPKPWEFPQPAVQQQQEPAPVTPTAVVTPPPTPSGPMNAQLLLAKYQAVLMRSMPFLIDFFQKGASGRDFQEWLIEDAGLNTWNQFKKDATADLLIGAVGGIPQLAQIFQPPDRVRQFFTDLLTDWPEEEEDDADDDETPIE